MNSFNLSTNRLILGERAADRNGDIIGTGTLTVVAGDIDLYEGTISANLASTGTLNFEKFGPGTVTLAGDNSGLASTGITYVQEGSLVLDYTTNTATKVRTASNLEMLGSDLTLTGNASAAVSQTVTGLNLDGSATDDNAGANRITLNAVGGQGLVLNLGAINRTATNRDGTIRFVLPSGTQSATNGITTSTSTTNGILGGFATVEDGTGTWFATKTGNNITALVSTAKNDVSSWLASEHITDTSTGFTGTLAFQRLNSLRFDAAGGSAVNLGTGGVLNIASGGILVTNQVTSGAPGIFGGSLSSGINELIITHDSARVFEISSSIGGAHAVTKSGVGTLKLSGNNFYTDETEILQGILQVSGGNAIGDNSTVSLAANRNTTLQLLADETIGLLQGGKRATNSDYGTVAIGSHTLTINETASTTYAGFFTGDGTIVMNTGSTGNLQLTNNSAGFTGAVVINGGLFYLNAGGRIAASSITINKGGNLLLAKDGATRSADQVLDTVAINLNSADGGFSGATINRPRGLGIRTDQESTNTEVVGVVTANSGANYVTLEATSANDDPDLRMNNLVRNNSATLNVRGTVLGLATANVTRSQFEISNSTNETAFIGTLVGGGGAAGTQNISIVPWAIGESFASALGDLNMGNSLVTYIAGSGFRPLDFLTEYDTIAAAAATDNARAVLTSDLTGLSGTTVNALVLHNDSTTAVTHNVTGTGSGQTLAITSGALLFTLNTAAATGAYGINLGGFDSGISVGGTNEYVIHVIDPSSAATPPTLAATIASALTSVADITKSGRGTLILSGNNTAGGNTRKTTINEGILEITDLDNIGGGTGALVFAGGTLRLGTGFADDLSSRTISFLQGGGTIDTQGANYTLANSVGSGVGGLTKIGTGMLTFAANAAYTGTTTVADGRLVLNGGGNNRLSTSAALVVGSGTTSGVVQFGDLINGASNQTVSSLATSGTGTTNAIVGGNAALSTLTVDQGVATTYAGAIGGAGANENNIALVKTGGGILNLTGASTFTGGVTIKAGTLAAGNSATALGDVGNVITLGDTAGSADATLNFQSTQTYANAINVIAGSSGALTLLGGNATTGAPTLSGAITLNNNLFIAKQGTTGAFTLSGGITGTGNVVIENMGTTGTIALTTNAVNHTGSLTHYGYATGTTTISADIGSNLTAIIQNSATAALTISSASIGYTGSWTVNAGTLNITGVLSAPGLVKNGAGLLTISNVGNATTWDTSAAQAIVINGGIVEVQGATGTAYEALGTAPGSTVANNIVLDGGSLGFNLTQAVSTFSSNRGIVVGSATGSGTGGISVASGKTVTYGGIIADNGTGADGFSKTGAGTLILTGANTYTGTTTVLAGTLQLSSATTAAGDILAGSGSTIELAGGTLALFHDGDGTASFENIAYGDNVAVTASSTIAVNRSALSYAPYFVTAANKTIRQNTLALSNGATLTVTNSNGYGLEFTGATDLGAATPTFSVGTANTSLQIPGLVLSGVVSGSVGITKAGNGTLKLGNTANTFTGDINITNGTVEGVADASFGNAANQILIGSNAAGEGLRISGTFATNRTIHLNAASSGIDVTGSNTFTLNNAFTFATATNALTKNDLGTLVLTQAQTGWNGVMTINQGVLRIKDAGALGTTTGNTTFGNVGGALEIDGGLTGMTIAENFVFAPNDDVTTAGVNGGGAIRSISGANILTGTILLNTATGADSASRAATFTADLGASLEIAGVVTGNVGNGSARDSWIGLGGAGDGILSSVLALGGTPGTNRFFSINKFGTGTWTITAADAHPGTRVIIKEGILVLSGSGSLGTPTAGQETPPTVYLNPAGELKLDNVSTDVDNRLSGRALNVSGADVTILGNAAGTTETVGAFTLREGLSIFTLDADAGGQLNFATGALTRSVGATLLIRGDQFGSAAAAGVSTFTGSSYAYIGQTGAAGTVNKGILPWAVGDTSLSGLGVGFVTSDTTANTGTSILRLLAPSEQTANFATAGANVNLSTTEVLSTLGSFNSLRLGSGGGVLLNYVPLTLESGGLLTLSGNTGITGFSGVSYLTTSANAELILHTVGDLTLAVPIAATTGVLTKSGAGTLTLTAGNTSHGAVVVNDGILKMGGGDQTILPGRNLQLNHGGSLDLNGTVQQFNVLESRLSAVVAQSDLFPGDTGGKVINTGASQATLVIGSSSGTSLTFAGSIEGNIAFTRSQASASFSDWNLYSEMTYTGATLLSGGRTQLLVEGSLLNTSSVEIAGGTLLYSGSNANTDFKNITNRINDTAPVTLRGGALQFNTTASLITTETMGAITLAGGNNFISMSEGGTRVNRWDLTAASLSQAAGSRATIRFSGIDATPNDDSRLFLTSAPTLTNNIIGGWAVFEREFASYTAGQGVGGLGVAPVNGYAGYSPSLINDGTATDNIRIALPAAASTTLLTGNRVINSLNLNGAASATGDSILDLGGNRLTLVSGGLIASSATNDRAINIINGELTAGVLDTGGDLYLHTANLVVTDMVNRDVNVSANIVNNGTGAVSLVISGDDGRGTGLDGLLSGSSVNLTGNNTYTGGTWVNSGRVILNNGSANGTSSTATGTGDLTISGGASTNGNTYQEFRTSVILGGADQIFHTATVNLNGSARLNLNGFNQTIANLIINNTGGHNPEVTTGAGTLTITGSSITASGQNASSSAFSAINGKLALGAATTTFTVHPIEWNGEVLNPIAPNLTIGAVIEGTNLVKAGNGVLRLTGSNAFTGSFDLQAGGLALGSNNALSTGLFTIGDGTFLASTADNRVIANAYVISGSFALRDAFNLTLNGNTTLAAGQRGISVDLTGRVLALGGVISGVGGINKTGDGILLLNNSSSYTGGTTVTDGILRYGVVNALPTAGAVTVLSGGLLDITSGGSSITIGSLAGSSATQGGVVFHGATSGAATLTIGGNNASTAFGGIIANAAGSTLNLTKIGTGTLTLGGANQYNGTTTIEDGRLVVLSVSGGSALGSSQSLVFGGTTTSGILQLGDGTGAVSKTFTGISSQGSGTTSQIVSGNAVMGTLTFDLAATSTFVGNIGGAGTNEANLNLVKNGAGDLVISGTGTSLFGGSTAVNTGKLFMDTVGAFSATTAGLTLADGTEFALRGTVLNTVSSYGFSGTGNVITVGSSTGATLGFGLDGTGNTQLNLATGQTMDVNGTLTTAVYVNSAPVAGHKYVLINGTDANSLSGNGGVFELNPVIFNGGSFTYALSFDSGVHGGGAEQWVLTPTAQPALADVWWKGDLTGLAAGVWSATLTSGTGFPSNWAAEADGLADALVPPDQNSIVHFSAAGAANFTTTLGANMTIQALIFHTGNAATTIGSSNGINTLTLGNTSDASGLTLQTGVGDVGISAIVALAQSQSWNIEDTARVLNLSGGLVGTGMTLTVNDAVTNAGTLLFSGAAATMTGTLAVNAGTVAFTDTGSLNSGLNVVLGTASASATLLVGGASAATDVIIGGLSNGSFAGSRVIGGNATVSTLTIGATSGSHTFTGALGGAGANENNFNLVKAGAGTQILDGSLTYTGTTLVRAGTLQLGASSSFVPAATISVLADAGATAVFDINGRSFTTVGDLTLGGNGAGSIAQMVDTAVTKGTVTLAGNVLYNGSLNGAGAVLGVNLSRVGGLTITSQDSTNSTSELTLNGTLTGTGFSDTLRLTFTGAGNTIVNGAISITGSASDIQMTGTGELTVNAATSAADDWLISGGVVNAMVSNALNAADDVVITGTGTQGSVVVNIGGTAGTSGVHQGNEFYIRGGAHVNVLVNNGISTGTGQLLIGDSGSNSAAAAGLLNLVNANISPTSLLLGTTGGQIGIITGTGTLSTTGIKELRNGTIGEGITLAGNGAIIKNVVGAVTFYGQRDVAATGAVEVREGELILDYTLNNNSKIGSSLVLGINSAITNPILTLNGSATAATLQSVGTTTIASAYTAVNINNGSGQTATLALGGISRAAVGGAVAFRYSSADAVATSTGSAGTLGWATVGTGLGVARLAAIDGSGNIVAATTSVANDVAAWVKGMDVINDAAFTGTVGTCEIESLTFAASAASTVTIGTAKRLVISSGGILVSEGLGNVNSVITGGELTGGKSSAGGILGELIIHQNNVGSSGTTGLLTIASSIVNSSGLTKTGAGILVLTGSNTFRPLSQVSIFEGTLRIGGGNAIGDNSTVMIRAGATLDLNNSTETIGTLSAGNGTLALGTGTLTINQTAAATSSAVFTGGNSSTLVKTGTSTLTYTGTSAAFTGTLRIDQGQLLLSGNNDNLTGVNAIILNGAGSLRNDQTNNILGNRIKDTATITLNNTSAGEGLRFFNSDDGTRSETVGALTLGAGHNVITAESTNGAFVGSWIFASLTGVNNHATSLVRGTALGSGTNDGRIRFTAAPTGGVGTTAGGAIGTTKNLIILPYLVGDVSASGLGNSFVTYRDATNGLRPLAAAEYEQDSAAPTAGNNVRYTATTTITAATAVNSLVIDATTGRTITGPASDMEITSGAILSANASGTVTHTIAGFGGANGITTGGGRDYTVYVTSATGTLAISSKLGSAVALVKSGAGILSLTNTANAFTDVYLNQGSVQVDNFDKLGTGDLYFFGGNLRLATGFTGDFSGKEFKLGSGGGGIDTNGVNATATNLELTGAGDFRKLGTGTLTIGDSSLISNTGRFVVSGGTLLLNNSSGNVVNSAGVLISGTTNPAVLRLGRSDQIADTAIVELLTNGTNNQLFDLNNFNETIAGLVLTSTSTTGTVVRTGATGVLTVTGDIILSNNRTADANTTEFQVLITGTGSEAAGTRSTNGFLDLGGAVRRIVVQTTQATPARNDAVIETVIQNGGIIKEGDRTLYLRAANTYAGATTINNGTLSISSAANLGDSSATNTVAINHGATLQNTGANVDLGVNRGISLDGIGGTLQSTGTNRLTVSGVISGHDCADLTVAGPGLVALSGTNTYEGRTLVNGGTLQVGVAGAGSTGTGVVTVASGATLAGSGVINGSTIIGGGAVLQAGDVTTVGTAATTVTGNGGLIFTAASSTALTVENGGQIRIGISNTATHLSTGVADALTAGTYTDALTYISANGTEFTTNWNVAPGSASDLDYINLTGAGSNMSIGTRASGTFGNGSILVSGISSAQLGQVFNLLDWQAVASIGGTFTTGGFSIYDATSNVMAGDLDLTGLGAGLAWDVSAFATHGILVVVPEPSRALLIMLGLLGLLMHRRRRVL
jgi:autotransporter-associated beta strand protein